MASVCDLSKFVTRSLCLTENTTSPVSGGLNAKSPYSHVWDEDPSRLLGLPFTTQPPVPEDTLGTPIQEFYRGVNVFITGGSGFLGKVLVEKLLRSIPHIGHIYLLIREKRGKNCRDRFHTLLEDKLFSKLKVEVPDFHTKVSALAGDISQPGLGLSAEDRQLILDSVHVVFHCAADVRFLEPLRVAVQSNVLGAKNVLDLAKLMTLLKAYVHVSTAYSQCVRRVIDETVPKMSINYKEILQYVESHSDSHIEHDLPRILQEWPNTYTFTKAMCEDMIVEESEGLPLSIFRPSVVHTTYREPFRGWLDTNVAGCAGFMMAENIGILHHYISKTSDVVDLVPVDYVINCMIATAWSTSNLRDKHQPYVLNFTCYPNHTVSWKAILKPGLKCAAIWPYNKQIWYPSCLVTESYWVDEIFHLVVHKIQGFVFDKLAVLTGQKPRMSKIYSTIYEVKDTLSYFSRGYWEFNNNNVVELWHSLTEEDKKLYYFDCSDIDNTEFVAVSALGSRYFFMKDSMESIPAARKKYKLLYYAHVTLKISFGLLMLKLAASVAHILPF